MTQPHIPRIAEAGVASDRRLPEPPAVPAETSEAGPAARKSSEFLPSIALMRAIAALMVVYDHLVGLWLERNHVSWRPAQIMDRWIFDPLHVMMNGGGLAVAMFFLVSGFVIVYVAQRETLRQFSIRRALRIFPPLWASIILLLLIYIPILAWSGESPLRGYAVQDVLGKDNPVPYILSALSLVNYFIGTPPVNGVAWTLAIEVQFYLCVALLLPLLKIRPRLAMCIAFGGLYALQYYAHANFVVFLVAVGGVYVTFLFLGSLVYLRWAGRVGTVFFAIGTIAFGGLFVRGVREIVAQPPYSVSDYGVSYAYAWLAFVGFLLLDEKLRLGRVSAFFSRISYSLYLNHGAIGMMALTLLYPWLGYPAALALAFPLVVAVSAASYRWVEAPSQRLARRLTARTPSAGK